MALWAADLEAYDWDRVCCACAVSDEGDRFAHYGDDARERLIDLMHARGGTWVFHFGGGYDVPLLLETRALDVESLTLTGARILKAESKDGALKIRDSFPLTLSSLATLAKYVGMEKGTGREELETLTPAQIKTYCMQDCDILLAVLLALGDFYASLGAARAWTAGAASIACLRALEPDTWENLEGHRLQSEDAMLAAEAIRGARVEAFIRGRVSPVYAYDIKSSYPTRYADRTIGFGLRESTRWDREGLYYVTWVWPWRDRIPPVLDQGTLAGYGQCAAWLCRDELEALRAAGAKHLDLERAYSPQIEVAAGQTFVARMFALKEQGVPWAKVQVNSLHGKFSEKPLKDQYTRSFPLAFWDGFAPEPKGSPDYQFWKYKTIQEDYRGRCAPHLQPIAAGQILGRARAALSAGLSAVEHAGGRVFYCDTDCIHTNLPPDRFPMPQGVSLGQWALEAGPCEGYYLGPKGYLLVSDDGETVKMAMKGAPAKSLAHARKIAGVYESRPPSDDKAQDLRIAFFKDALRGGARIRRGGVSSFLTGLRAESHWGKSQLIRTIKPTGRNKTLTRGDYAYRSPDEIRA